MGFSEGELDGAGSISGDSAVPMMLRVPSLFIDRGKRVIAFSWTSLGTAGMGTARMGTSST